MSVFNYLVTYPNFPPTANNINYPPYKPATYGAEMADKTLCGDHVQYAGIHYDTHNLYGWFESEVTAGALREATGLREWALSRSTYVGSGRWVAHWLGDNTSRYAQP